VRYDCNPNNQQDGYGTGKNPTAGEAGMTTCHRRQISSARKTITTKLPNITNGFQPLICSCFGTIVSELCAGLHTCCGSEIDAMQHATEFALEDSCRLPVCQPLQPQVLTSAGEQLSLSSSSISRTEHLLAKTILLVTDGPLINENKPDSQIIFQNHCHASSNGKVAASALPGPMQNMCSAAQALLWLQITRTASSITGTLAS
jgi:hypothetical protein